MARPKRARLLFLLYLFLLWRAARPWSERSAGGPSYDLPLSHSWRAARAGPLSVCLSCFIAPALARGLSSERALRRRPISHFPFWLISALPAPCVSALHRRGGGGGGMRSYSIKNGHARRPLDAQDRQNAHA